MKKIIAVIGDSRCSSNSQKAELSFELGKALISSGYRVLTGGRGGVMEEVMRGAKSSPSYCNGDTIAILPTFDCAKANPYADIVIPTGLDIFRNGIVANSDAVVAIGGGAGTLSEIAYAWSLERLIVGYRNIEGWSSKLAGEAVDHRRRYKGLNLNDQVYPSSSAEQTIELLNKYCDIYNRRHIPLK